MLLIEEPLILSLPQQMTKELPQEIILGLIFRDIAIELPDLSVEQRLTIDEIIVKHFPKNLSLPKQEKVCDACYGKGKYSVYKGDAVAGVDFPGDKPFVVEQGGVKEFPCPKCKGKQEQEDTLSDKIHKGLIEHYEEDTTPIENICIQKSKELEDGTTLEVAQEDGKIIVGIYGCSDGDVEYDITHLL